MVSLFAFGEALTSQSWMVHLSFSQTAAEAVTCSTTSLLSAEPGKVNYAQGVLITVKETKVIEIVFLSLIMDSRFEHLVFRLLAFILTL